jgi:hypothetical protein
VIKVEIERGSNADWTKSVFPADGFFHGGTEDVIFTTSWDLVDVPGLLLRQIANVVATPHALNGHPLKLKM